MTVREGAIISAYTGVLVCETMLPVKEYVESILERPVTFLELSSISNIREEIRERSKADFEKIITQQT